MPPKAASIEARLEASRKFAIEVSRMAQNTRCHNVVLLDMTGISAVTDFYVIATGTSAADADGLRRPR